MPLLSLVIWLPILGGVAVLFLADRDRATVLKLSLSIALATFVLSLPLYFGFDTATHAMQLVERVPWIPAFGIEYHLGIDGISLPLILLTTFTNVLVILAGFEVIEHRLAQYMAAFLILEGLMNGVFAALDAILFYVFWEAMLVPMFLIIGIWGGEQRVYATIKFFLYTFLGSVFMLVALLYLYYKGGSFSILAMHGLPLDLSEQMLIFIAFLLAFAVKVPMWPVHTWLPDAHVEAPTGGSVILAAIMLKMGGYGFLRFSLPIVPDGSQALDGLMIALSLIAIVYIGFVALVQEDMKKLIAYSSISHMGFVTLGLFVVFRLVGNGATAGSAAMGIEGGMVQMISHGFVSGALFLCVGVLYERIHSRRDPGLRRGRQHHAGLRRPHDGLLHGQRGAARHLGVRGRVPGDPDECQGELLVRGLCRDHPRPGRGLHAMDVQARDLRRGGQRARREAPGPQPPRARDPREPRGRGAPLRRVARADAGGHARDGRAPGRACLALEGRNGRDGVVSII